MEDIGINLQGKVLCCLLLHHHRLSWNRRCSPSRTSIYSCFVTDMRHLGSVFFLVRYL